MSRLERLRQRARKRQEAERAHYQRSYNEMQAARRRTEQRRAAGERAWGPADWIYWGVFAFLWLSMWF